MAATAPAHLADFPPELLFEIVKHLITAPLRADGRTCDRAIQHVCAPLAAFAGTCTAFLDVVLIPGVWTRVSALLASLPPPGFDGLDRPRAPLDDDVCYDWVAFAGVCGVPGWSKTRKSLCQEYADVDWLEMPPASVWDAMERLAGAWAATVAPLVDDERTEAPDAHIEWPYRPMRLAPTSLVWNEDNPMAVYSAWGHLPSACACGREADFGVRDYLPSTLMPYGFLQSVNHPHTCSQLVMTGVLPPPGTFAAVDDYLAAHPAAAFIDLLGPLDAELLRTMRCPACTAEFDAICASASGWDHGDCEIFVCKARHVVLGFGHWCL